MTTTVYRKQWMLALYKHQKISLYLRRTVIDLMEHEITISKRSAAALSSVYCRLMLDTPIEDLLQTLALFAGSSRQLLLSFHTQDASRVCPWSVETPEYRLPGHSKGQLHWLRVFSQSHLTLFKECD